MEIREQLQKLRKLQDGWLDGEGRAPDRAGLDWLSSAFDQQFPSDLALPYMYPTPEGHVRAEWSLPPHEISLEIDLEDDSGEWHHLNLETDKGETRSLDLDDTAEWGWVSKSVRRLSENADVRRVMQRPIARSSEAEVPERDIDDERVNANEPDRTAT